MNTSSIPGFVKYKAGNKVIYQGKEVFVSSTKRPDNKIVICDDENLQKGFNYDPVYPHELKPAIKLKQGIVTKSPSPEKHAELGDMTAFFDSLVHKIPFHCQNCGKPLYAFTKKAKRAVSCHILPKAKFTSIATDPDNILFMGCDFIGSPCDDHTRWDYSVDNRIKMPVYKIAVRRFNESLRHKLTDSEVVKALDYLGIAS